MATTAWRRLSIHAHHGKPRPGSFGVDKTVVLEINGTLQRLRLCGARAGLPPLLVVQAGPGFALISEAGKFQQSLQLEESFSVAYWDQRGCGRAPLRDTQGVSLETQVDDLCIVVRWLAEETGQKVLLLGISLGATIALQAAARETSSVKALVAVSIDTDTAASDASALSFLQETAAQPGNRKLARLMKELEAPPHTDPAPFQRRARLLTDLGGIERGKRFGELLRGLLYSLVRTYGWLGAASALRNMSAIQRKILPEVAALDLFANWPRPAVPVHYVFGERDPLTPRSLVQKVSGLIARDDTVTSLPNAGHMVHFDEPAMVRSVIAQAHAA